MPSIDLHDVGFAYVDSVPLLADLTLQLSAGWTAVVGSNGAGKTTLLRLLAGELEPDSGAIQRRPAGMRVHLCPQRVDDVDDDLWAFAHSDERDAHRLRGQLMLEAEDLASWPQLSPGERKRWQIGAALAGNPGALLLDEPTNHLDAVARELLEVVLRRFEGVGVLVSHDRALVNALTTRTLRVRAGEAVLYQGAYDKARGSWEAEEEARRSAHQKLRGEQKKLKRRIDDRRRKWDRAVSRATTSKRMKNPRDSAARAAFKATRRRSAENALGREIHRLHGSLGRVEERAAQIEMSRSIGRSLFVDFVPAPVSTLAALSQATLYADEARSVALLADVYIDVKRDTRLHLRGANGTGKTSLLRQLIGCARIPNERMLHLPQELGRSRAMRLLRDARELAPDVRGRLLSIVAALGVEPEMLLESEEPSPGEARKLALASGLARQVWWLVLDEPTNHLDLPSIERLEVALAEYPGAIVLATHDDRFAARITTTRLELGDGARAFTPPAREPDPD